VSARDTTRAIRGHDAAIAVPRVTQSTSEREVDSRASRALRVA
jgi:hypothetical protein